MTALVGASAQLREVAVNLKAAGDSGNRLALMRGLKIGAAPLIPAVQAAARAQLPKSGGLNEQVAGQKVSVSIRTGARTAGVRLTTTAPDTSQTDSGFVRHPTFGHRDRFVTQKIPDAVGWWSQTLASKGPPISAALVVEINMMAERIQAV